MQGVPLQLQHGIDAQCGNGNVGNASRNDVMPVLYIRAFFIDSTMTLAELKTTSA